MEKTILSVVDFWVIDETALGLLAADDRRLDFHHGVLTEYLIDI
jgi:hypothetical protein